MCDPPSPRCPLSHTTDLARRLLSPSHSCVSPSLPPLALPMWWCGLPLQRAHLPPSWCGRAWWVPPVRLALQRRPATGLGFRGVAAAANHCHQVRPPLDLPFPLCQTKHPNPNLFMLCRPWIDPCAALVLLWDLICPCLARGDERRRGSHHTQQQRLQQ